MAEYKGKHFEEYSLPTFNKQVQQIKQSVLNVYSDINEHDLEDRTFAVLKHTINEIEDRDEIQLTDYEKQYIIEREKEYYGNLR